MEYITKMEDYRGDEDNIVNGLVNKNNGDEKDIHSEDVLIMSWNVASLSTTCDRIKKDGMSLSSFLDGHSVDIFCVQEHKIALEKLQNRSFLHSHVPGWQSYWSCCTVDGKTGFNGVATYVRTSKNSTIQVDSADPNPLQVSSLDRQGRCLLTVHSQFCVLNVYIPCRNNEDNGKMHFLDTLYQTMQRIRQQYAPKPLILVGDLNMTPFPIMDRHWSFRYISLPPTTDHTSTSTKVANTLSTNTTWELDLKQHWPTIKRMLSTKKAFAVQTKNIYTNVTFQKWRVMITNQETNKNIFLGGYELTAQEALYQYEIIQFTENKANTINEKNSDPPNDDEQKKKTIDCCRIDILAQLMSKCVGINWSEELQRHISRQSCISSETTRWFQSHLLQTNNHSNDKIAMVDTFRHLHPKAQERFTCWNQYTSERCNGNRGSRIDFILIDTTLQPYLKRGSPLRIGVDCDDEEEEKNVNSPSAAWKAATANGKWQGSSFTGDGIFHEFADLQYPKKNNQPHTGIVYTPPSYSDHVPVTALFSFPIQNHNASSPQTKSGNSNSKNTRMAQPHLSQPCIAQFFSKPKKTTYLNDDCKHLKMTVNKNRNKQKYHPPKPKKDSILHHFVLKK